MEITHWVLGAIALIFLYMNLLASIAIWKEEDLNRFQKGAQLGLVWLLPIFGAPTVLYFIFHQSPEVIPVKLVIWPFRSLVMNKRMITGGSGSNDEEAPGLHCAGSHGSSERSD